MTMKLAALVSRTITIPGDERSRTHPGHGYPESQETTITLHDFKDEAEMAAWVKRETTGYGGSNFKLIRYEELIYETSVEIKIKR